MISARASSLLACGVSHHSAALRVREAAAIGDDGARSLLRALLASPEVGEAAVLATCNRTEVYAVVDRRDEATVRETLLAHTSLTADELRRHAFTLWDDQAVEHLFRVAAGLESAVLGEPEISAQVRAAARRARQERALGPILTATFDHALVASARARRMTGIGAGATSIGSVVAQLIAARAPASPVIALVGAGRLAASIAGALAGRGLGELVIVNRGAAAGTALAARHAACSAALERLAEVVLGADVVILATRAPHALLDAAGTRGRGTRPLLVIDLAVPRNADPALAACPHVEVHDLDAVHAIAARASAARRREAGAAARLLRGEVARFGEARRQAAAGPVTRALWREAERVRRQELARLGQLEERERALVEELSRVLIRRLLDTPTRRLRELAEQPDGAVKLELVRMLLMAPEEQALLEQRDVA